jgi:hypothetical protein
MDRIETAALYREAEASTSRRASITLAGLISNPFQEDRSDCRGRCPANVGSATMGAKTTDNNFLPRGLRREDAAYYVGVSPAMFDEMVKDGRMPLPKKAGKRTIWDRHQLDASFEDLPDRNDESDWDEAIRNKVKDENQT